MKQLAPQNQSVFQRNMPVIHLALQGRLSSPSTTSTLWWNLKAGSSVRPALLPVTYCPRARKILNFWHILGALKWLLGCNFSI